MQYWPYGKYRRDRLKQFCASRLFHLRRYFVTFRSVDDTPRQTISILYERNTIDFSIEPCSTEDEFCCKRADVVLYCVAQIVSSLRCLLLRLVSSF